MKREWCMRATGRARRDRKPERKSGLLPMRRGKPNGHLSQCGRKDPVAVLSPSHVSAPRCRRRTTPSALPSARWLIAAACLLSMLVVWALHAAPARAGEIVSLGDSYSSGEGNAPYDDDSHANPQPCHRSGQAWPRLIGVTEDHHLACSGAKIENLANKAQVERTPDNGQTQITRLIAIGHDTPIQRVVMTIGGNDKPISFASRLRNCVLAKCVLGSDQIIADLPSVIRPRLEDAYRQVMDAAKAPLLVVGYPDLLPAPGSPSAKHAHRHCAWLDHGSMERMSKVADAVDSMMSAAAASVGADYLSMRGVFAGHELCTGNSWIRALGNGTSKQQGHPLKEGQTAMALRVLQWLNTHRTQCTAADSVAAILDNSGSMDDNDPENIRAQAMRLLLTKPDNQGRMFGATKFGDGADTLFAPSVIGPNQASMLAALSGLDNQSGSTDYNAAFAKSAADQPGASARIFLTDGAHNAGVYDNGHRGGPPTYVIGLNIGAAGTTEDADRLQQIATDTGGKYFPLKLADDDTPAVQVARLQPTINDIGSRLTCDRVQAERTATVSQPRQRSAPVTTMFAGSPGMEVVLSWPNPDAKFTIGSLTVRDRGGRVVGDLTGTKLIARSRRQRTKIGLAAIDGQTFSTVSFRRPAYGSRMALTVVAPALPSPTQVTIQIRPIDTPPSGPSSTTVPGSGPRPQAAKGTIKVAIAGSGSVSSNPAGVACPTTCTGSFDTGTSVTLTPAPAPGGWTFAGWSGACSSTGPCTVTADQATAKSVQATFKPPPPQRVDAYSNYGAATAGRAMCRGNPGNSLSMPGGTATQTFAVPSGVASLDHATIQIDPDSRVNAHLTVYVNGQARASADAAAAGDTQFSFSSVPVSAGETVSFSVSFSASFGKIITVYSAAAVGGTLTVSNSCPDGAPSLTTSNGLRAVVSGWSP